MIIKVENLTKRFNGITAVDDISFEVEEGTIFGFLGPNGAGKTQTINILCTLLSPTSGKAQIAAWRMKNLRGRKAIGLSFRIQPSTRNWQLMRTLSSIAYLYNVPKDEWSSAYWCPEIYRLHERKLPCQEVFGRDETQAWGCEGLIHRPRVLFLMNHTRGLIRRAGPLVEFITECPRNITHHLYDYHYMGSRGLQKIAI